MDKSGALRETVLQYAKEKYGTEPDFPWMNDPMSGVLRHKHNKKWYGLVMEISRSKLGLAGDGKVNILNVKSDPMLIGALIDRVSFFPAYHMNREHWMTILLDGSAPREEVFGLLDRSYSLTKK